MTTAIVYMVAGMASRFGGKIKQFALIGKNNETLIEYSMNQALKAGFGKIIFIVGEKTEIPFKEKFGDSYNGIPILYAKQEFDAGKRDKPWGTNDALCSAKNIIDCNFVVCNGDDIYGEKAFKKLEECARNSECATVGWKLLDVLPDKGASNRGIIKKDKDWNITEIKEEFNIEKAKLKERNLNEEDFCSMNIFALKPEIVSELAEKLEKFKQENQNERKAECLLPTELANLIKNGKLNIKLIPAEERCIGVTCPEDEEIVRKLIEKSEYGELG
ncbi:hypothetical protein HYW76_05200 [Candidatus Pacearchaeota archaeon]|nr:hypothetical protein [Candidatus Pacearchaeota archaeon]